LWENIALSCNPFERPSGIRDPYSGGQHEETRHGVAFGEVIEEQFVWKMSKRRKKWDVRERRFGGGLKDAERDVWLFWTRAAF
jgi:hypothetical protein